jgi:hypothetical protein
MKFKSQLNLFVDLTLFLVLIPIFIARGEIHSELGYLFGLLIIVHLILHAKQIFALFQARFKNQKLRSVMISAFCILCILVTLFSLMLHGDKDREGRGFEGRQSTEFQRDDD